MSGKRIRKTAPDKLNKGNQTPTLLIVLGFVMGSLAVLLPLWVWYSPGPTTVLAFFSGIGFFGALAKKIVEGESTQRAQLKLKTKLEITFWALTSAVFTILLLLLLLLIHL